MKSNNRLKLKYPLVIDGGLSNVLESLGCNLNHELWSAKLLTTNEDALVKTHLAYLEAGAQVISTASYQATIPGFMKLGHSKQEAERLILKSVDLAEIAVNEFVKSHKPKYKPLIAASIGPYGAYLADGSEYRGDYGVSDDALLDFHKRRIELLDASNGDVLAIETVPSYQETLVLSDILKTTTKPAWISFSCTDGKHINDGTPIRKAASILKKHPNIFAVGVNCSSPQYISELIGELKSSIGDKKIIIYPNSGEVYDAKTKTWSGISNPELFKKVAKKWIALGANIIGGCCRIGPSHIQRISKTLKKH